MDGIRNFTLWFAWRQLIAKKGHSLSFLTTVSILGISIGVATLVVVLSVMGGMARDLKKEMFRGLPHSEIYAKNPIAGFSLHEFSKDTFYHNSEEINYMEPFIKNDVVIKKGKNIAPITLLGIEPETKGELWGFHHALVEGSFAQLTAINSQETYLPGVILGQSLAMRVGAKTGDIVHILSPQTNLSQILSGAKISTLFKVRGIFFADSQRYNTSYALVSLAMGRKFLPDYDPYLDEEEYVSGIAVRFNNPDYVDQYKKLVSNSKLQVISWKDVNKSLLFALKLEKYTMGSILLLIVLVAAFSISATIMMTVFHKRNQIALLRSLGMSQREIAKIFITHGSVIGFVGVVGGLLSGIGICFALHYGVLTDFWKYFNQRDLPVSFLAWEYAIVSLSAWLLSICAAIYPAVIAAQQEPSKGLRFT